MKKSYMFLLILIGLFFCQCSSQDETIEEPKYNEYISAYTGGTISRNSEIKILLSEDVPASRLDSIKAKDVLRIEPNIDGECEYGDSHTLVFRPKGEMKRNAKYNVKVKISKLFANSKDFEYAFKTRPFVIGGGMKSFDVTEDDQYELTFNLITADDEKPR